MIGWIRNTLAERRRGRQAVARAAVAFESKHGQSPHVGISTTIHQDGARCIVRVCYGHVKPPCRAFFVVPDEGEIEELQFEDVTQFGECPWR